MKYDNKYKKSTGIKCTETEKTTTAIDQESLNPSYKSAVC